MKITKTDFLLPDVAFRVREMIENHAPRFVAVVATPSGAKYGQANTSFLAIVEAVGMDAANDLVADMQSDSAPYLWDENFGHDTWRAWSAKTDELLAILVRA